MVRNYFLMAGVLLFNVAVLGCQPKTPAQKMEDKAEDAAHETGQGIERAGEKVKDAGN